MSPITYTLVINTYHRPVEMVERCLRSALNQDIPAHCILLIDQNPDPLVLSNELSQIPHLRHLSLKTSCVSRARSSASIPKNGWLVFCDDDATLYADYSVTLAAAIRRGDADLIAGLVCRNDTGRPYSRRQSGGRRQVGFINSKLLLGSNFVIRAEVFHHLGCFNPDFGIGCRWGSSEETLLAWLALDAGENLIFDPTLRVSHRPPYVGRLSDNMNKAYRYGVGKGALVAYWLSSKKNKWPALFELVEMSLTPIALALEGIIRLNPSALPINLATLFGRHYGMIQYFFKQPKGQP